MKTPLATYDIEKNTEPVYDVNQVVWAAILDKRFKIEVQRKTELKEDGTIYTHLGTLLVFDSVNDDVIILEKETPISYGALFGPDIDDLNTWQNEACNAVDSLTK